MKRECAQIMKIFGLVKGRAGLFAACATAFMALQPLSVNAQELNGGDDLIVGQLSAMPTDSAVSTDAVPQQDDTQPQQNQNNDVQTGEVVLKAKLADNGDVVQEGMIWRIYSTELSKDNKLTLVAISREGIARVDLKPGSYLLSGSFGRAQVMRRINVTEGQYEDEVFVLDAGGLKLNAVLPKGQINKRLLRFSIYIDDNENDEQALVIANVKPEELVRLKEGDYYVVSNYGSDNAVVRYNTHVEAGRIIDVTIQHQAAQITLKLVRQEGGEALADTSWSIANDSGDIVRESIGAYASLVLAEGDYVAIAKNKEQIYQKDFSVTTGSDREIDVVADARNQRDYDGPMD